MKVVFIGAGNVATHLTYIIKEAGHSILQVFSKTIESSETLASKLQCECTTDCQKIRKDADIYIISVSDRAIDDVVGEIPKINPDALWVHTSGSVSIDSIKCSRRGVLYPLQTFSKQRELNSSDIPFFIESNNDEDLKLLNDFASSISSNVQILDSEKRKYIHLAAVFCCNFVNHCCTLSSNILEEKGIPFYMMLPLIDETISKLHELSPSDAQTGPAVRFDKNIIDKHLSLLENDKDVQHIYSIMSKSIYDNHFDRSIN